MSHDASPTGHEPAEGYAGAGSPWTSAPDSDEPRATEGSGTARAQASVPQARGSASVQPATPRPAAMDEPEGWQVSPDEPEAWQASPDEQSRRPGPFPPAGPPPQGYVTPPASGSAPMPSRATGAAQVPGTQPPGQAQVSPAAGYAQVSPPAGSFPAFPPGARPPQAYAPPGQEYGQPPQAYNPGQQYGQPPQAFNPGQPPQAYNPGQQYGQPTQAFNPGQQYGAPGEGYPAQGPSGYPPAPFQPQREMPTNVYGTPSVPPTQSYDPQGYGGQQDYPRPDQGYGGQQDYPRPDQGYGDPAPTGDGGGGGGFGPAPEGKNKRLLLILALVAVVVVLAAVTTAVTLATRGSSVEFAINDCVKQSGSNAVKASCSDSGAYDVINKVKQQSDCADANQPFVVVSHKGGKDDVLCLRPHGQK